MIPVRECKSAAEVLEHARAVRLRQLANRKVAPVAGLQVPTAGIIDIPMTVLSSDKTEPPPGPVKRMVPPIKRNYPSIEMIVEAVAREWQVTPEQILGRHRARWVVVPRHIAIWLAVNLRSGFSISSNAKSFGKRDHTTALNSISRVNKLRSDDVDLSRKIDAVGLVILERLKCEQAVSSNQQSDGGNG